MAGFWKWCVRNLAAVCAVFALVLGQWGGLDWAVALSAAAVCGLAAKVGDWRYESARAAEEAELAAQAGTSHGRIVQFPSRGSNQRDRAA